MSSFLRKRSLDEPTNTNTTEPPRKKIVTQPAIPLLLPRDVDVDHSSIDPLANGDVASIVFSYLDCRELLNMASTSKLLMERLTYQHVLQASLMHGGHARTSVERLVSLVKDRRIYVPSPLRLLRVANGKRCENCGVDKVNLLSADYGVFFGRQCCLVTGKWTRSVPANCSSEWSPILSEPRMARSDSSTKTQVFAQPFFARNTGEPQGPLLTATCWMETCQQREDAVVKLLQKRDKTNPNAARRVQQLLRDYEIVLGAAQERMNRDDLEVKRKQELSWTKYFDKSHVVVQRLDAALQQRLIPARERDILLEWTPPTRDQDTGKRCSGKFASPLVTEWMSSHLKVPSKFNAAQVAQVAEKCRQLVKAANSLMRFQYLSKTDSYERILLQYCRMQSKTTLQRTIMLDMDAAALEAVQQGYLTAALEMLLLTKTIALEAMAAAWSNDNSSTSSCIDQATKESLASLVWDAASTSQSPASSPVRDLYRTCSATFSDLNAAFNDFMAAPETEFWLSAFSPRSVGVECLMSVWQDDPLALDILLSRDFMGVLHLIQHGTPNESDGSHVDALQDLPTARHYPNELKLDAKWHSLPNDSAKASITKLPHVVDAIGSAAATAACFAQPSSPLLQYDSANMLFGKDMLHGVAPLMGGMAAPMVDPPLFGQQHQVVALQQHIHVLAIPCIYIFF